jgi:glycosyltransferase involved in cell wall biosynthesis
VRILYIADIRSATTHGWTSWFVDQGHEVHVISLAPGEPVKGTTTHMVPLMFSSVARSSRPGPGAPAVSRWIRRLLERSSLEKLPAHVWWGTVAPADTFRLARRITRIAAEVRPDIVHALRIPVEGELATSIRDRPVILSVWGDDFTLWAARFRLHRILTCRALRRADALFADCERDIALARQLGLPSAAPAAVVPGGGGIQSELFHPGPSDPSFRHRLGIPIDVPFVVNPRGYHGLRVFLGAAERVLEIRPDLAFVVLGVSSSGSHRKWVTRAGTLSRVMMPGRLSHADMAELFRQSAVHVSAGLHDGTPNTLLEGMACGSFPVYTDLPSIREWLEPGRNGLLYRAGDSEALANAMVEALDNERLRRRAIDYNLDLVRRRAARDVVMPKAMAVYEQVVGARSA